MSERRGFRPDAGSVVRRSEGTRTGLSAGTDAGDECSGAATVAKVLVGLSMGGMLKSMAWGEMGLTAFMLSYILLRNCCRASTALLC